MFAGWILLPVEVYPPETITWQNFTVDVIGTALPSNALIAKAWIVPMSVLVGLGVAMRRAVQELRFNAPDLGIALFCLSPALPFVAGKLGAADALIQTLYLAGTWGGTWLVGRVLMVQPEGRRALTDTIIVSGVLLLPVAILEGLRPAWLYSLVYGAHAFQLEGAGRYFGFRPLGFFEHGNQYGIWMAVAALAATFRWIKHSPRRIGHGVISALLVTAAVASQSAGAILLLGVGCAWIVMSNKVRQIAVIASGLCLATGGVAYMSGKLPVERWAYETNPGQTAVAALRNVGRISLAYRVRRDQMALPILFREPITGYGVWDWWRQPMKTRPWGLPLLVAGQYGFLSLIVIVVALLAGAVRQLWRGSSSILALIVVVAAVDAWLNSFIYFPAILASAALAMQKRGSPERTGSGSGEERSGEPPLGPEQSYGI